MEEKKWVDFEITKVKLNPEQAVLSCCDNTSKIEVQREDYQCNDDVCGGEGSPSAVSS